ncbi:hypothetical protein QFX20_08405 [Lampropedia aestuarii]|nr:hypothetical protein [Lampropedia aestuarii]MDH5857308.1 hypothetical protein [Lampropedia aestuarii]
MITPRSASKFDLFAQAGRHRKLEEVGDPLQVGASQNLNLEKFASTKSMSCNR